MTLRFTDTTLEQGSNHLRRISQIHHNPRKYEKFKTSYQCWFFFTVTASCVRNLFHQERLWTEISTAMFWESWEKCPVQTSSQVVQQFLGPAPSQCIHPHVIPCVNKNNSHGRASLFIRPRPLISLFLKTKLRLKRRSFGSTEGIQVKLQNVITMMMKNYFHQCSQSQ